MKAICPLCEDVAELDHVSQEERLTIRGEEVVLLIDYLRCRTKGHLFQDPSHSADPLDQAFREYRRRHSMLLPEEIREFRTANSLTQRELSAILGWGGATLSRYENGALQDEAHDRQLHLAVDPKNLLALIKAKPEAISKETHERLLSSLAERILAKALSLRASYEDFLSLHAVDDLTGYRSPDFDRISNAVRFFCVLPDVFKTKLNKLLFYADFKHFKDYAVSITGAVYAHLPYGPAPERYDLLLAALEYDDRSILLEERTFPGFVGETVVTLRPPDLSIFRPSELRVLAEVSHRFQDFSAKQMADYSHQEEAYSQTNNGDLIPYALSERLSI